MTSVIMSSLAAIALVITSAVTGAVAPAAEVEREWVQVASVSGAGGVLNNE